MEALVIVLIAVVALAGAGLGYYLKMRRRDELAMSAQQHGLDYSVNDAFGLVDMSASVSVLRCASMAARRSSR